MKSKDIKKGMMVRISNNLSKTRNTKGLNEVMKEMKGLVCPVYDKYYTDVIIRHPATSSKYTFHPDDLTKAEVSDPHPPVTFNPENIVTS